MSEKRFLIIACEVLFREVCLCAAKSKNVVDISFQKIKLHDLGEVNMSQTLQNIIDSTDCGKYDAILLGYGLCNNGIRNLHAPIPMVVPRAHDCITLLLGSKEKYADYFNENGGTYFYSSGWLEHNVPLDKDTEDKGIMQQLGLNKSYQEYVEKYGEENAEYIMSMLGNWVNNYSRAMFINNGVGDIEIYRKKSKEIAENRGWEYEEVEGSISLIEQLIDGDWNEADFMIIPPENKIEPSYDTNIISCVPL